MLKLIQQSTLKWTAYPLLASLRPLPTFHSPYLLLSYPPFCPIFLPIPPPGVINCGMLSLNTRVPTALLPSLLSHIESHPTSRGTKLGDLTLIAKDSMVVKKTISVTRRVFLVLSLLCLELSCRLFFHILHPIPPLWVLMWGTLALNNPQLRTFVQ